jgi:hypothetical protein
MTQDEILETLHRVIQEHKHYTTWTVSTPHLVALVKLAIEHEREECAKISDEWAVGYPHPSTVIAEAIRARGQA